MNEESMSQTEQLEMVNDKNNKEQIEQYERIIEGNFKENSFKSYFMDKVMIGKEQIGLTVTIAQEKYFDKFLIINDLRIIPSEDRIESFSHIARFDGEPYVVEEKYLRLLLGKYFVKVNSTLRFGCLAIDPETGIIKIKMNSLIQHQNIENVDDDIFREKIRLLLKQLHQTNHYVVSFQIYKILHLINQLSFSVFAYLNEKLKDQYRKINDDVEGHLNTIRQILDADCCSDFDKAKSKYKNLDQYFKVPKQSIGIKNVISRIHILTTKQEFEEQLAAKKLTSGGFGTIYRFEIKYQHLLNRQGNLEKDSNVQKRILIVKVYGDSSNSTHEKDILRKLESDDEGCPFIAKYYYSTQDAFTNYLFIENYSYGHLANYKTLNNEVSSLNTKLYILYQVAMGLNFLKKHSIVHIDLKPGNVVLGKNLVARIIDFGESQLLSDNMSQHNSGYTFPYIAPEQFYEEKNKQNYSFQTDVFSFGMMMYELLFDDFPVDFRKHNQEELKEKYKSKSYVVRINENFIKEQGPKHLMKLIRIMILKCLEVEKKDRPQIEWIIVLIREMMNYLEKLY